MTKQLTLSTRAELLKAIQNRYSKATKKKKTRILDEFVAVTCYHRKHAIRLLGNQSPENFDNNNPVYCRRIYDEAVKEALIILWEASDRICGKRLKSLLPNLIEALEHHGHIDLDPRVRQRLLVVSAATIDRLLSDIKKQGGRRRRRKRKPKKVSRQVPVRTFADWGETPPGSLEIDFVVHGGGSMAGNFIHTLVATDICTGWVECIPLLAREQSLVVEAFEILKQQLPFPILKIDSDNDSAFINDTLFTYCEDLNIEFTRSRPFRSNDQAWVEQKNGAVIRRFVGYERFSGVVAGQTLASLYQAVRLFVNYYQPSFKLVKKERKGAKIKRFYDKPLTPFERLCINPTVSQVLKKRLQLQRKQLDPVFLLHQIRECQAALAALVSPEDCIGPGHDSLEKFLAQLPKLWRSGEVRPTHRDQAKKPRNWRTRKDPFEEVWPETLKWLQKEPDITAKLLLDRLQTKFPGKFTDGQLRTLQRRVKEWRNIMAKHLVYSCFSEQIELPKVAPVGVES